MTIKGNGRSAPVSLWTLFAPVTALVLFTMALAGGAVWFAVERIDEAARATASRLAIAAVDTVAKQVRTLAQDYAVWEDVTRHVLVDLDPDWARANIGEYLVSTVGTSATIVIDRDDSVVYAKAAEARDPFSSDDLAAIVADLAFPIGQARSGPMNEATGVFCLVRTSHGLAIAGIAPVTPENPTPEQLVRSPRPVLVFLRPLDAAWLRDTEQRFGLDNLRVSFDLASTSEHAVTLFRSDGSSIARLDWDSPSPGLTALRDLAVPAVILVLLALAAAVIVVRRAVQAQLAMVARADALSDANADLVLRDQQVRSALQRAEHATRSKSSFLARISHEIRTPLTAIIGFSQILKLQHRPNKEKTREQEYAEIIHESSQHLLALVNDLLDLSKIESGGFEINESWVDLSREVAAVRTVLGVEAERKGVSLSVDLPHELPALYADAKTIRQILTNLVSNALKFTPTGGQATIRLRMGGDGSLSVMVADTGAGIPLEDREAIWQPFTRARNPALAQTEGTGLGLYLVKMLAEMHEAEVGLDSEVGEGTTVTVTFGPERLRAVAA